MTATRTAESVLRVSQVADHLDCTTDLVYSLIRKGELRAINVGRLKRIPVSALDDFLSEKDE